MTSNRALVSGLFLLFAIRLLAMIWVPLTDPTEARYAEIARIMVDTGNWITPQFDYGIPFWAKPPLHTWLAAIGIEAFGSSPFAARIGILFSTILTLVIVWRWTRSVSDPRSSIVATLVTASTGVFFFSAAFVQTDMVLTLGVVASMAGFYNGLKGSRSWGWLFFLGLAIGLLAKGPIAVVLTMTPIALWMIWRRDWQILTRLPWIGGTILCLALVLPWYAAAEIATPGYLRYFLIGEHIERFLVPGWKGDLYGSGREHAKGTIWLFWIIATLPWSPLLPVLLWRYRKTPIFDDEGLHLYLLLFALTPLVFFTAAANILIAYVLPGIPAAAILAVILWTRMRIPGGFWLKLGLAEITVFTVGLISISIFDGTRTLLPTEDRLVAVYQDRGRLAILRGRSFSSEFYSKGEVTKIKSMDDLSKWLTAGDGVLVRKADRDALDTRFGSTLSFLSEDKNYALYISNGAPGVQ
ncbi:glycosyltransferase family 39 protein [Rhizobium sp. BK376]|uniref:ArnT family glycosyltransferase n=1 Tax=Rhizobium sp. BK376 TaxID=2512149 RepID=UPI00104B9E24|nr:glycosyltransferase family 39 protein [Rhizobium sp. BK376]TCR71384.1 dolichyl-phosphate-mannose-protein mannosyltransferase [Rhizobium sp. BK376]